MPTSLKSAFSSLAATVSSDDGDRDGEGIEDAGAAFARGARRVEPERAKAPAGSASGTAEAGRPGPDPATTSTQSPPTAPARLSPEAAASSDDEDDLWEDAPVLPATSGDAASTPASDGSEALRAAVMETIGRSSPLLRTGLATSLAWTLEESRLVISFRNGIEENVVKGELPALAQAVAKVAGRALKVELKVAESRRRPEGPGQAADENPNDAVTLVVNVFRGQRVQAKSPGGSDGF